MHNSQLNKKILQNDTEANKHVTEWWHYTFTIFEPFVKILKEILQIPALGNTFPF
jgi:D-alanyl-D-alanine dipeptidase